MEYGSPARSLGGTFNKRGCMTDMKLDPPTWAAYQRLDEKYQTLLTNWNEVKRLLKQCGFKEEVHTIKMLKELAGVR